MKKFIRKNRTTVILIAGLILFSGGITAFLIGYSADVSKPEEKTDTRLVETDILKYTPYTMIVEGHGFVESSRSLNISARTSGQVIKTGKDLKSGISVSKGDLLIVLDDEIIRNSLSLARVQLIQAVASLLSAIKSEQSGTIYHRWNSYLNDLNAESGQTPELPAVESEREKLLTSTFGVLSALYQVREKENLLSYYRISAPFDGHLEGDGVPLFSFITTGQSLLTLTDTVHLEVAVPLTREDLILLDSGNTEVMVYPGGMKEEKSLPGQIVRQDAVMDRSSQTVTVHIRFDNPDLLPLFMPGNYVDIKIRGKTILQSYAIPRSLINADQTVNIFREGKLDHIPIEIQATQGDQFILAPTLPEGTEIILTRLQKPLQGMALAKTDTWENSNPDQVPEQESTGTN